MTKIARPIGKADMEFYEGAIVLRLAHIMSGKEGADWEGLTHRTKNKWLDRAVTAACDLLNDKSVVERLIPLTRNLMARL